MSSFDIGPLNEILTLNKIQLKTIKKNKNITKSEVLAITNYFKKGRKKAFEKFLNNSDHSDTFYICDFIRRPNLNEIHGFIWNTNNKILEFNIHNDSFDIHATTRNTLSQKNRFINYFLDSNFKELRYKVKQSYIIADGCIVLLAKIIKKNNEYYFEHLEFEDFGEGR